MWLLEHNVYHHLSLMNSLAVSRCVIHIERLKMLLINIFHLNQI